MYSEVVAYQLKSSATVQTLDVPFKAPPTITAAHRQPTPLPGTSAPVFTPNPTPDLDVDVVSCTPPPANSSGSSSSSSLSPCTEKKYFCQRCLNHGEKRPRKGHKLFCKWSKCPCDACAMVEHRRQLSSQLRKRKSDPYLSKSLCGTKVRAPKCARCGVHGQLIPLRGHNKKNCPYSTCTCDKVIKCSLVEMRRMLMAKQIKLRREQQKERKAQQNQGVLVENDLERPHRGVAKDGKPAIFEAFSQPTGIVNNTAFTNVPMTAPMNDIRLKRQKMLFAPAQVAVPQNPVVDGTATSLIPRSARNVTEIQRLASHAVTTRLASVFADARTASNSLLRALSLRPHSLHVSMSSPQSAIIAQERLAKQRAMPMSLQQMLLQQRMLSRTISAGIPSGNLVVGMPQLFMYLPVASLRLRHNFVYQDAAMTHLRMEPIEAVSFGKFFAVDADWTAHVTLTANTLSGPTEFINGMADVAGAEKKTFNGFAVYEIECNATVPSLFLTRGGQRFEIPPAELVRPLGVTSTGCMLNIEDKGQTDTIHVGAALCRKFCLIADYDNARFGLAPIRGA